MEELGRWTRDAPPTHFILKIESFSTLSASSIERFESPEFEAVDAKWKIVVYPNGNKAKGGEDHISVYLVLADKSCLSLKKELLVTFRLFAFDQIRDKYLTVEGERRFNEAKYESGFDKFLPLGVFNDATNGYLLNGTCLFGAEVFLIQHTYKLKCLSMVAVKCDPFTYRWKIDQFSNKDDKEYFSEKFTVGGYDWKLKFCPKGEQIGKGTCLSLHLCMANSETSILDAEKQVIVELKMRLVDQLRANHRELGGSMSFGSSKPGWGWGSFLSLAKLKNESNGYLVNDSVIVEADVNVLGSTKNCV